MMRFVEFRHASQKGVMNGIIKRNNWGYYKKVIGYGREFRK